MIRARSVGRSIFVILVLVGASRTLGFLREWMVAHQIGSGASTDAYYAAFTLPDFLNYLIASSALEIILVPIFSACVAENRKEEAWHVFSTVVTSSAILLSILIASAEILAPQLVRAIVPGFPPAEMVRVVFLTRIMLPAQLFLCLGVVFISAQVAHASFALGCAGAVVSNAFVILGGWLLAPRFGAAGFAIGVLVGSFCGFFLLQLFGLKRIGARFRPNLDIRNPRFREFVRLAIPLVLALSVVVTDDWILRWFGSFLRAASITWITYAKMLARIPMSTVGYAVGLGSYPQLAKLFSEGKHAEMTHTITRALRLLLLFLLPVSAFVAALHSPIAYLFFSHTRLKGPDIAATASTLGLFALGIGGFGIQGLLARGFYAMGDTATPAAVGTTFTFAGLPVYWYLGRHWDYLGLAAASSCVITLFAITMFCILARRLKTLRIRPVGSFLSKVLLASGLSGIACHFLAVAAEQRMPWEGPASSLWLVAGIGLIGFAFYTSLALLLRIEEAYDCLGTLASWARFATRRKDAGRTTAVA